MGEATASEKRPLKKNKTSSADEFEASFRPKKSHVNFGRLKKEHPKAGKKKRGKSSIKAGIAVFAVIALLGGAGAGLYFTGYLTPVLQLVGLAESPAEAQPTLEEREALLAIGQKALSDREKALLKKEEELAAREEEIRQAEDGMAESVQSFGDMIQSLSDDQLQDLKRVSAIYSKMDPGEAADILASMYDLMEISSVLYYMQPAASALVLEQMEAGIAADITEIMLS